MDLHFYDYGKRIWYCAANLQAVKVQYQEKSFVTMQNWKLHWWNIKTSKRIAFQIMNVYWKQEEL